MGNLDFSIAEGKKNFSKIIKTSEEKKEPIVISRRGKPVAIIIPYEEYQRTMKKDALREIHEARESYRKLGISAKKVYEISRGMLEETK